MQEKVHSLVKRHINLRPASTEQDIYKLLFQSCLGLGHLLESPSKALFYLEREMGQVKPDLLIEDLVEDISLCHPVARINLKPYKKSGLSAHQLFDIMLKTEKQFIPSKKLFITAWSAYSDLVWIGKLPGDADRIEKLTFNYRSEGFPPAHHSDQYRKFYSPAYRIVDSQLFSTYIQIDNTTR